MSGAAADEKAEHGDHERPVDVIGDGIGDERVVSGILRVF